MPSANPYPAPSLSTFMKSLKTNTVESSIEQLVSLLKRGQIRNSRQCALATAHLLRQVVAKERINDAQKIIDRIRDVGRRLIAAQPREMAVGNIVRRVLGVVREVVERAQDGEGGTDASSTGTLSPIPGETKRPGLPKTFTGLMPLNQAAVGVPRDGSSTALNSNSDAMRRPGLGTSASYAGPPLATPTTSLLSFLEHPLGRSPAGTPPTAYSPSIKPMQKPLTADGKVEKLDLKAEVIDGIRELLDELEVVDTQIAESALDHIHSNETILTHTSSQTIQKFLMAAAHKRRHFTVVHAEAYPNDHEATHATILNGSKKTAGDDSAEAEERWKPLTDTGYVTVILIPDTAVFALMSRINKVLLAPHAVLANGSLIAAAGASTIALIAQAHKVPVVVLSGVYKLSPVYPFDLQELIQYGDPGKAVPYGDGEFLDKVDVVNPVHDFVEAESVDLYITNLGGCAPSFLYRIVADHYRVEDVDLAG